MPKCTTGFDRQSELVIINFPPGSCVNSRVCIKAAMHLNKSETLFFWKVGRRANVSETFILPGRYLTEKSFRNFMLLTLTRKSQAFVINVQVSEMKYRKLLFRNLSTIQQKKVSETKLFRIRFRCMAAFRLVS